MTARAANRESIPDVSRESTETLAGATNEPMKDGLATSGGIQDYYSRLAEFVGANIQSQMDFVQRLAGVRSPSDYVTMFNDHSSRQIETLTRQAEELVTLVEEIAGSASDKTTA
jgi:hypothetical protein